MLPYRPSRGAVASPGQLLWFHVKPTSAHKVGAAPWGGDATGGVMQPFGYITRPTFAVRHSFACIDKR